MPVLCPYYARAMPYYAQSTFEIRTVGVKVSQYETKRGLMFASVFVMQMIYSGNCNKIVVICLAFSQYEWTNTNQRMTEGQWL